MKVVLAVVVAISLAGPVALAQDARPAESTEARLARIEQAISRLEQKLSASEGGGMMERCREMMGAGMMGSRNDGRRDDEASWQQFPE